MRCIEIVSLPEAKKDVPWKNPGVRGLSLRVSLEKEGGEVR